MADRNDFKVVAQTSINYFSSLCKELNLPLNDIPDNEKARLGFYHLILEAITDESDLQTVSQYITDTKYNAILYGQGTDDLGIDAVYIKESEEENANNEILLFNFKYREQYKPDQEQEESALSRCEKFLNYIVDLDEKLETELPPTSKTYCFLNDIREKLNSLSVWDIKLFVVSNETKPIANQEYINRFQKAHELKVECITLETISNYIFNKKIPHQCKFLLGKNDCLSFNRELGSTDTSFIVKLSLIDVVRITCTNVNLLKKYDMLEDSEINGATLNESLLYDNVRGFLGQTIFNKKIQNTLINEPENFFIYNNGLTLTSSSVEANPQNTGNRFLFELQNFQIVNGGQTIRSIYEYLIGQDVNKIANLRKASVLVRIFKVSSEDCLKNKIAEYTNSQNAISAKDLKSVDQKQIQIEAYLKSFDIQYVRKTGTKPPANDLYRLGMDTLAKIIFSAKGFPEKVTSQKTKLFTNFYDEIFGSSLNLDDLKPLIDAYRSISRFKLDRTEQQACYVLYIMKKYDRDVPSSFELLTKALETYEAKTKASDARKLIQKGFKLHLDSLAAQSNATSEVRMN